MNTTPRSSTLSTLAVESEAIQRYRELEEWFDDRGHDDLAALCAKLAAWHRDAYMRRFGADHPIPLEALKSSAVPWAGTSSRGAREFIYRVTTPRAMLGMALEAETSEACAAELRCALTKLEPINWEAVLGEDARPSPAHDMG
jgi:hypothetical protein